MPVNKYEFTSCDHVTDALTIGAFQFTTTMGKTEINRTSGRDDSPRRGAEGETGSVKFSLRAQKLSGGVVKRPASSVD